MWRVRIRHTKLEYLDIAFSKKYMYIISFSKKNTLLKYTSCLLFFNITFKVAAFYEDAIKNTVLLSNKICDIDYLSRIFHACDFPASNTPRCTC